MLIVDIAIVTACISIIGGVIAGVIAFAKVYHKHVDLPMRVVELEQTKMTCQAKDLDIEKLNETLELLLRNMERDLASIRYIEHRQGVMMEGMMNIFKHVIKGNNVDAIQESYECMVEELLKVKDKTERG